MSRQSTAPPGFLRLNAPWLGAGALLTFCSSFGQTYFIAIFAGEIQGAFGLSHGAWGSIYATGTLGSAALMIWAGGLVDRMRVKRLGALTLLLLAAASAGMAAAPGVWALLPVILGLRFAGQGMAGHIATTAMARWFVATRGRALAIATLGFALGEAVLPVTFVAAMSVVSWRVLWLAAAAVALLAIPLLSRLLVRERVPQGTAEADQTAGLGGRHWRRAEMLRHPLFWCALPALIGPPALTTALFFQQVHLAELKGWGHVAFVALFPLYTGCAVAGLALSGWAIDRFGSDRTMPLVGLPVCLGFVILAWGQSLAAAALGLAAVAVTTAANATVPSAFWAEFYGTRHMGSIRALGTAVMVFGTAIGPALSGVLIDAGIGFDRQMAAYSIYFLVTAALLLAAIRLVRLDLPRYRPRPAGA